LIGTIEENKGIKNPRPKANAMALPVGKILISTPIEL
jgi:hypothetical protein